MPHSSLTSGLLTDCGGLYLTVVKGGLILWFPKVFEALNEHHPLWYKSNLLSNCKSCLIATLSSWLRIQHCARDKKYSFVVSIIMSKSSRRETIITWSCTLCRSRTHAWSTAACRSYHAPLVNNNFYMQVNCVCLCSISICSHHVQHYMNQRPTLHNHHF